MGANASEGSELGSANLAGGVCWDYTTSVPPGPKMSWVESKGSAEPLLPSRKEPLSWRLLFIKPHVRLLGSIMSICKVSEMIPTRLLPLPRCGRMRATSPARPPPPACSASMSRWVLAPVQLLICFDISTSCLASRPTCFSLAPPISHRLALGCPAAPALLHPLLAWLAACPSPAAGRPGTL